MSFYYLNISKSGTGSGTVTSNPPGINCGVNCSEAYTENTVVTLTATPDAGSTFAGWSGACSGTACTVTMDIGKDVTANFDLAPTSALFISWSDNTYGNNEIFLKKSTDNGATWQFQRMTNNTGNSTNPSVAASGNNVYVV